MTTIRVGVGGWVFAPWRGTFYPPGLPQARELEYASRHLTAIEINGTFYGSQKPASFRRWRDETPDDFMFSLKGPRFATHRRDLREAGASIERFFTSGVLELGDKLGPVLWQFPGTKRFEPEDFGAFLKLLPPSIEGRSMRHVVEVSHASFAAPAFIDYCASMASRSRSSIPRIGRRFSTSRPISSMPGCAARWRKSRPAIRNPRSTPGRSASRSGRRGVSRTICPAFTAGRHRKRRRAIASPISSAAPRCGRPPPRRH